MRLKWTYANKPGEPVGDAIVGRDPRNPDLFCRVGYEPLPTGGGRFAWLVSNGREAIAHGYAQTRAGAAQQAEIAFFGVEAPAIGVPIREAELLVTIDEWSNDGETFIRYCAKLDLLTIGIRLFPLYVGEDATKFLRLRRGIAIHQEHKPISWEEAMARRQAGRGAVG